ncbi:hypothetical protein CR513_43672, partial [Mucuna pruriens]
MENNERTLKELATLDVVYQPWCIQYPQLEPTQSYELKSGFIHLRRPPQAFEGIPCGLFHNETVGDTKRLHQNEGIPILLGWSSEGLAFFLTSRTATIRKEICGIRQQSGETLHEYLESNHFGQGRVKGHMQLNDSTPQYQAPPFQQQQQQRMPPQGNSPSLEDLMKQIAANNLEPQDADRTTSQYCEPFTVGWIQQPSFTNNSESKKECKCCTLRSGKELSQPAPQLSRSTEVQEQEKVVPLLFPTQTISARKPEFDEELLKMFRKVETNIPLLDAIM